MQLKQVLFFANLVFSEVKAQTNSELRAKVLNALRAKTESAEMRVTSTGSDTILNLRYTVSDLNPETLHITEKANGSSFDLKTFFNYAINAEIISYAFFNSEIPKPFGMNKKFHITYTPVKTDNNSLTHYLVYYDQTNYYPIKVIYYNGAKKVTTVEYSEYKQYRNKIWRAHLITSENHLNLKKTRIELSNFEINSEPEKPRMGQLRPATTPN